MSTSFSVVIPTMNEELRIERLLKDIKLQSIQPDQIIVADKSMDSTPEIAKKYGAIIVEGVNDYHIGKARNNGARIVTSEIIFFLDADNRLPDKRYFEKLIKEIDNNNLDISHSLVNPDNPTYWNNFVYTIYNNLRRIGPKLNTIFTDIGGGIVFKKEVFDNISGFREDLRTSEDLDILQRAQKLGYKYRISGTHIQTSDRRINDRGLIGLGILIFTAIITTLLIKSGLNSKNKVVSELEDIYWKKK
jgi:glycosyltransferase involved in cell wall biosynthesis